MDALAHRQHHVRVRVLPHIKKLDDCFGEFLVRVSCPCGAYRHIEPEALARIVGTSVTFAKLVGADALLELREESRGSGCSGKTEAARNGEGITKAPPTKGGALV
jgi:hypothetical protein